MEMGSPTRTMSPASDAYLLKGKNITENESKPLSRNLSRVNGKGQKMDFLPLKMICFDL